MEKKGLKYRVVFEKSGCVRLYVRGRVENLVERFETVAKMCEFCEENGYAPSVSDCYEEA